MTLSPFSIITNLAQGNVPNYVLYEDFNTLDPTVWEVYEFGSPDFDYSVGPWIGEDSWVYIANMPTGGLDPPYNGYHFVHTFDNPLDGAFTVEAGIGWSAPSNSPASQTALRLLNATHDVAGDQGWSIQAQCRDYWVASPCLQVFHINTIMQEGYYLPLEGFATIRIERNEGHHVQIYWDNTLFLSGIDNDTITRISLRIVGRYDYPGASGGFNYVYTQLPPLPPYPQPIFPPWFLPVMMAIIGVIVLQFIVIVYLIRKDKEQE